MFLKLSKSVVFAGMLVLFMPQKNYTVSLSSILMGVGLSSGPLCRVLHATSLLSEEKARFCTEVGLVVAIASLIRSMHENDQKYEQAKKECDQHFSLIQQQQQQIMAALERLEQTKS